MPNLDYYLTLDRCPYCSIDNPNLSAHYGNSIESKANDGKNRRLWKAYVCGRCGGVVIASAYQEGQPIIDYSPKNHTVDSNLPTKVRAFLQQAIDSVHAPAGCIMLCASSVDAMLKEKGLTDGNLNSRIILAVQRGFLTVDMGTWAHQVRLDANDQRHADINAGLPTVEEARQAIEFTKTLGEILFVLPSKVTRGIQATSITGGNSSRATNVGATP